MNARKDRAAAVNALRNALASADNGTLAEAIALAEHALSVTPSARKQARIVNHLGTLLRLRFERTGNVDDLGEAVGLARQAVAATHPFYLSYGVYRINLAATLQARYIHFGDPADIEESVSISREVAAIMPRTYPERGVVFATLASGLKARFDRAGDLADLDESAAAARQAIAITRASDPMYPAHLHNFASVLRVRYIHSSTAHDLDESIQLSREAIAASPVGHSARAVAQAGLATGLLYRYRLAGTGADLAEAIDMLQEALLQIPASASSRAYSLTYLADAYRSKFGESGDRADIDEAVSSARQALSVTPDGSISRPGRLHLLGSMLMLRHEVGDLDEAIELGRQAVTAALPGTDRRAGALQFLAEGLLARFKQTSVAADLEEAVSTGRQAVAECPQDSASRALCYNTRGTALFTRFTRTKDDNDLEEAVASKESAASAEGGRLRLRIWAARDGSSWIAGRDVARAAALLEQAIRLFPQAAPRQARHGDQQYTLAGFTGMAADAAALALTDPTHPPRERAERALGLLEQGRAVILSQALDARSDLTELGERHPALTERCARLLGLLDSPATVGPLVFDAGETSTEDRWRLVRELNDTLTEIRAISGFESFLLPPPTAALRAEGSIGPVVVLTTSPYRSDALLLTTDGVTILELPKLDYRTAVRYGDELRRNLRAAHDPQVSPEERVAAESQLAEMLEWLWTSAAEPVLDALGCHAPPPPDTPWPRVWWAPTGPLSQLPIHAAGLSADRVGPPGPAVIERVVSSYTSTVRALGRSRAIARSQPGDVSDAQPALIVGMSATPGIDQPLPFVNLEVEQVAAVLPGATRLIWPDPSAASARETLPVRASVLGLLPAAVIAHFACHGVNDPDPSQSRLLLQDHATAPLTVSVLNGLRLDQHRLSEPRLAYLSACGTALTTAAELRDEAIHLASAFQLVGFPHVIATLWEINDGIAARVAGTFYENLTRDVDRLSTKNAAQALHAAVTGIRAANRQYPSRWAAYIHLGI